MKVMYKNIFKSWAAVVVVPLLLATCAKSDDKVFTFTSQVRLTNSSIKADQAATSLWFSTNNGASYSLTPFLSVGKKFKVKVMDNNTGKYISNVNCNGFDWSSSNPKADNSTSDNPEFTMADNTSIVADVVNLWVATDTVGWSGNYSAPEGPLLVDGAPAGNGSTDPITIYPDAATPNGLIMTNFFGDGPGVIVHFVLNPSTNLADQTVTVPTQTTTDPGTASGSGTYDQCTKALTISVKYVAFGSTYQWTYVFKKL